MTQRNPYRWGMKGLLALMQELTTSEFLGLGALPGGHQRATSSMVPSTVPSVPHQQEGTGGHCCSWQDPEPGRHLLLSCPVRPQACLAGSLSGPIFRNTCPSLPAPVPSTRPCRSSLGHVSSEKPFLTPGAPSALPTQAEKSPSQPGP